MCVSVVVCVFILARRVEASGSSATFLFNKMAGCTLSFGHEGLMSTRVKPRDEDEAGGTRSNGAAGFKRGVWRHINIAPPPPSAAPPPGSDAPTVSASGCWT